MTLRNALKSLLILVLALPMLLVVMWWVATLLSSMGDHSAAAVLGHVSLALRVLWLISAVGLLVVLALQSLATSEPLE